MALFIFNTMPLIMAGVIGIFLFFKFKKMPILNQQGLRREVRWIIAGIIAGICGYFVKDILRFKALIVIFLCISYLVVDVIYLFLRKAFKNKPTEKYFLWIYRSGIIAFICTLLLIFIGFKQMSNINETHYEITTEKSIGDMRIVMISDIHFGTTMDFKKFQIYADRIQASNPDLLVLVGDIFDEDTTREEMEELCEILGEIETTYGSYYVFGNHDLGWHGITPAFSQKEIAKSLEKNNITVLNDETVLADDQLYIVGRMDNWASSTVGRASLESLLEGVDQEKFILLLDHQPLQLEKASQLGVDLQLSGHTHGGQIWLVGLLSEKMGVTEMNYGYRKMNNYQVIVSSGMGGWSYPLRLGSRSEYLIIDVKK